MPPTPYTRPIASADLDLPSVTHRDQPVVTTECLARAYGVRPKVIHDGFDRNRERFGEGSTTST